MLVGTGKAFQVPSLLGIGARAPYMHDGCAPTLKERFSAAKPCGGGDMHGKTSQLTEAQIDDLVSLPGKPVTLHAGGPDAIATAASRQGGQQRRGQPITARNRHHRAVAGGPTRAIPVAVEPSPSLPRRASGHQVPVLAVIMTMTITACTVGPTTEIPDSAGRHRRHRWSRRSSGERCGRLHRRWHWRRRNRRVHRATSGQLPGASRGVGRGRPPAAQRRHAAGAGRCQDRVRRRPASRSPVLRRPDEGEAARHSAAGGG